MTIVWGGSAAIAALVIGTLMSAGTAFSLRAPLNYFSDSIFYLITTTRLADSSGYFFNTRQGFPFGSALFDFVGSDWGNMFVLWGLAKASGSAAWANNVYYLISFPLCALAAFWCLRNLDISDHISAAFALLFSLVPFHFFRIQHLYFTWYFVVPIYFWFAVELFNGAEGLKTRWPLKAAVLMGLAGFGVYYAWFGCMMLMMGAVLGWVRHKSVRPIYAGVFASIFVAAGVVANLLPNFLLIRRLGANVEIAHRLPLESEMYALKIVQLILPRLGHRSDRLAALTWNYQATFPQVNENMTSTLGIVGVIGLFILLASSIVYSPRILEVRRSQLFMLGATMLVMLLVATMGGFSALFALLVTPLIRGWNRASIFISFLCLAGVAVGMEGMRRRFAGPFAAKLIGASLVAICVLGIWDQTSPADRAGVKLSQATYLREQAFFQKVEASLPSGSAIYQAPYMPFPEAEKVADLSSYDLGNGFLHSRTLKWSYGVAAGRKGSDFMKALALQPIEIQLEVARFLGFSGFLVDRRGFADRGKSIEAGLLKHAASIEDGKKDMAFYSLQSIAEASKVEELSPAAASWLAPWKASKSGGAVSFLDDPYQIDFQAPRILGGVQVKSASGLGGGESWGRWTTGDKVRLQLKKPLPLRFTLVLEADAFGPNVGAPISVRVGSQVKTFTGTSEIRRFDIPFEISESTDVIEIKVPAPTKPSDISSSADARSLGVGLRMLSVVE